MRKTAYILAALLTVSCVYPFTPDIPENEIRDLVVEGDILIGNVSNFTFSLVKAFDSSSDALPDVTKVWIEDGSGNTWQGTNVSSPSSVRFTIDMTKAPKQGNYSLHFIKSGVKYDSEPVEVEPGCMITGMGHTFDDEYMYFTISLSGTKGSVYRISWNENWEYKARYFASAKYLLPSLSLPEKYRNTGMMIPMPEDEDNYYCWDKSSSSQILTIGTDGLDSDILTDYKYLTMPVNTQKLSYIYCIEAVIRSISRDEKTYLENVEELSYPKADLFTPTPSMVRGNIRNSMDENELVIGYIGAGIETKMRHFVIAAEDNRYFNYPSSDYKDIIKSAPIDSWQDLYRSGYRTIGGDDQIGYNWVPARCVDCRVDGGTKDKPDFWPNDDK